MSSKNVALSVRGIGKSYTISHNQEVHGTAAEALLHKMLHPFERPARETFWALQDVSFDVERGDVVGIIGRNGAGKSTLLKVLSRITEPTTGVIDLYGRVGSLLEVGTGFHPELTGRENIFLNGAILGMKRSEIQEQFSAIVEFSGVEQFLDTPVKRYSSGMYVRLAFAVAANLRSEILVVDEVLSVGDAEFQRKCLGKMQDVACSGRTVLFVSHQMQAVSTLCNRVCYLEDGRLCYLGPVQGGIDRYMNSKQAPNENAQDVRRAGTGQIRFGSVTCDRMNYVSTQEIQIEMEVNVHAADQGPYFISMEVVNAFGLTVLHLDSRLLNLEFPADASRTIRYTIMDARLAQGDYQVNLYICNLVGVFDRYERACEFAIAPILPYPASRNDCVGHAVVYPRFAIDQVGAPDTARIEAAVAAV